MFRNCKEDLLFASRSNTRIFELMNRIRYLDSGFGGDFDKNRGKSWRL